MSKIPPSIRHLNDAQLEHAIQQCHRSLVTAPTTATKHERWRQLARLIKSRSPEAIARLERERGLLVPK